MRVSSAFVSMGIASLTSRSSELDAIRRALARYSITPVVFIQDFVFSSGQHREMMECAQRKVQSCDILLAEVSEKAIGVGIEVGMAAAYEKPIIYLRNANSELSKTVLGLAASEIVYRDSPSLERELTALLRSLVRVD